MTRSTTTTTTGKSWQEPMKAEPLSTERMDLWLQGRIPRRVMVIPFTGPLPGGKAGLDLDGEYFSDQTDLYGDFAALKQTRERLVDWHHDNDPTGKMKGAILGRVSLDPQPEPDGLWADFWANAGERRRDLLARLESAGVPLYGSSEPVQSGVKKASDGHIDRWPIIRHTITTSPQDWLTTYWVSKARDVTNNTPAPFLIFDDATLGKFDTDGFASW